MKASGRAGAPDPPAELVLPPKPCSFPPVWLPQSVRPRALQQYAIDVCDALVRACRDQVGAVLLDPKVIAAHFEAFTVEQARSCSAVLHRYYGAALPVSGVRS